MSNHVADPKLSNDVFEALAHLALSGDEDVRRVLSFDPKLGYDAMYDQLGGMV
jgi:hypothetical protein